MISERIIPCTDGFVCVPDRPHEMVGWGATRLGKNAGGELRLHVDRKVCRETFLGVIHNQRIIQVVHVTENAFPTCAAFADPETLVTGSSDYLVRLWRLERTPPTPRDPPLSVALTHFMRGHSDQVLSIAASRAWAMIVSGSADGTAIFWDLNRGTYTRSLFFEEEDRSSVTLVAINESTVSLAAPSHSLVA
jgi:WD40 repeat protein